MQINFDWVNPTKQGRHGTWKTGIIVSRNDYKCKKNGVLRVSTVVRLAPDVMKKARFVIGDRVMVGIATVSGDKFLALRRVPEGGYCISGPSARKGTSSTGQVKIGTDTLPLGQFNFNDVELTDEGILLAQIVKGAQNG